jgi:hypothetical protein
MEETRDMQERREKQDDQQKPKREVKRIGFRHPGIYFNPARKKKPYVNPENLNRAF